MSFYYPAGWTVYYPQDVSTMDRAVVTVASIPVLAPCTTPAEGVVPAVPACQRFTTPPGAIVLEFRVGGGIRPPDWSKAKFTIGGQPAFREDWGPGQNATGADEGHTWSVRMGPTTLGIYVSLRGPNLPALRAEMDEVLGSIKITQLQSPAP